MLIKSNVITLSVNVINLSQAVNEVIILAQKKQPAYVCLANVYMCMQTFDDKEFSNIVNNANLVLADGRPIFWAQKILGHKEAKQVRGEDLMTQLCTKSTEQHIKIGFYGGSCNKVLTKVVNALTKQNPAIQISYQFSPPFTALTAEEADNVINNIKNAHLDILFVGIGCPKQERWMAEHSAKVPCVMLGVGAAFDFISGEKRHAPRWMQTIGLEWFYRLLAEPRRLAMRYLKENPRFVYYFLRQLILK